MTDLPLLTNITPQARGLFQFSSPTFISTFKPHNRETLAQLIKLHLQRYLESPDFLEVQFIHHSQEVAIDKTQEIKRLLQSTDVLKTISEYPFSLKLSGLQTVDVQIKKMLNESYARDGVAITCNLYLTPAGDAQCFKFHVDPQDVYVVQVLGEKLWHFPLEGSSPLYDLTVKGTTPTQDYPTVLTQRLVPGQGLKVSRGIPHKAINDKQELSAHFSLSTFPMENIDFLNQLVAKLMSFDKDYLKALMHNTSLEAADMQQLKAAMISKVKVLNLENEVLTFKRQHQLKNGLYAKLGRPYSSAQQQLLNNLLKVK